MRLYHIDPPFPEELPHLLPDADVKRLLRIDDMGFDPKPFHPLDHGAVGKGQHHRLIHRLVHVLRQTHQVSLSPSYLSLSYGLENPYFPCHSMCGKSYLSTGLATTMPQPS